MNVFTEVADEVTYVGYHKIDSKAEKTYQILVRPDVKEECLLTLSQQILLTYGGQISRYLPDPIDEKEADRKGKASGSGRSTPSPTEHFAKDEFKDAKLTTTVGASKDGQEKLLSPYIEATNSNASATTIPWQSLRIYLGVNMDLQRCLVIAVKPHSSAVGNNSGPFPQHPATDARLSSRLASTGIFTGIGTNTFTALSIPTGYGGSSATPSTAVPAPALTPARRAFLDFCDNLASELNTAMREESLTLDYMHSVPAHMTGPVQGLHYQFGAVGGALGGGNSRAPDSLIDLPFIRDLHCATVQLMTLRLLEQADKLDSRVKVIEQKCARLMTLLKPSYVRAKLELPVPPTSKSITQYALTLQRAVLGDSLGVELWKLLLLRARRKCREILAAKTQYYCNSANSGAGGGDGPAQQAPEHRTEAQIVLHCITEQFVDWAQEEYRQRLFRKIHCVRDRLETIHRFRIQLILSLHERFVVSGLAGASQISTESWFFGGSNNPDLAYQKSVREKFPFLELTNPVIFDSAAILLNGKNGLFDAAAAALNGKTGTLYLSLDYLMFYAPGGVLFASNPEIVVIPLRSAVVLEVVDADGTVLAFRYATGSEPPQGAGVDDASGMAGGTGAGGTQVSITCGGAGLDPTRHIPANAKLPHTIRLVDSAGTIDVTVEVKGLTLDYTRRVGDLLDLILRDKLFVMRREAHKGPAASDGSGAPSQQKALIYQTIADIEDIRELLDLPSAEEDQAPAAAALSARRTERADSIESVGSVRSDGSEHAAAAAGRNTTTSSAAAAAASTTTKAPESAGANLLEFEPERSEPAGALPVPHVPVLLAAAPVVLPTPPVAPSGIQPHTSQGPDVKKSESSHLLELEDFFSELNTGITNIAAGGTTPNGATPTLSPAGSTHASGVFSKQPSSQSLSGSVMTASAKSEMDLFDDMLFSTAKPSTDKPPAAAPAAVVVPSNTTSSATSATQTTLVPASAAAAPTAPTAPTAAPVPAAPAAPVSSSTTAGVLTSEPAAAPAKKSLGGNIQKFLAQSQAQKAKAAAVAAAAKTSSAPVGTPSGGTVAGGAVANGSADV